MYVTLKQVHGGSSVFMALLCALNNIIEHAYHSGAIYYDTQYHNNNFIIGN